jgi:hypothetical protein
MSRRKGQKAVRNVPLYHSEVKEKHLIMVTPTSWNKMKAEAQRQGTSISELIELWAQTLDGE